MGCHGDQTSFESTWAITGDLPDRPHEPSPRGSDSKLGGSTNSTTHIRHLQAETQSPCLCRLEAASDQGISFYELSPSIQPQTPPSPLLHSVPDEAQQNLTYLNDSKSALKWITGQISKSGKNRLHKCPGTKHYRYFADNSQVC